MEKRKKDQIHQYSLTIDFLQDKYIFLVLNLQVSFFLFTFALAKITNQGNRTCSSVG